MGLRSKNSRGNLLSVLSRIHSAKTLEWLPEVFRFALVGILSSGLYFIIISVLLMWTGLALEFTAAIAYALSMVVNYLLQRSYTFRSKRGHVKATGAYLFTHAVGLGINSGTLNILVTQFDWNIVVGLCTAIGLVACWTYLAMKFWVFGDLRQEVS